MEFFAAVPERNNQVGSDQEIEVFADALAGHVEMATKFVQRLAVVTVQVIQQSATAGIGQGFKNIVHLSGKYATKWLHTVTKQQAFPMENPNEHRAAKPAKPGKQLRLLQVKRTRPEVDDPVVSVQDLGPE